MRDGGRKERGRIECGSDDGDDDRRAGRQTLHLEWRKGGERGRSGGGAIGRREEGRQG